MLCGGMNEGHGRIDRMGSRSRGWMKKGFGSKGRMGIVDEWKPEGVMTKSAGNKTGHLNEPT